MFSFKVLVLTLLLAGFNLPKCKVDFTGIYIASTFGQPIKFQKRIDIHCDSTVTTYFKGDMVNDKLTGRWEVKSDTLIIRLNPLHGEDGEPIYPHWGEETQFLIKKNKLIPFVTDAHIKELSISDKKVIRDLNKQMLQQSFSRTEKGKCD